MSKGLHFQIGLMYCEVPACRTVRRVSVYDDEGRFFLYPCRDFLSISKGF